MTLTFSGSGSGLVKVAGILPRGVLAGGTAWQAKVAETDRRQKDVQKHIP